MCVYSLSGRRLKRIDRTVLQQMTSLAVLNLSDNQLRLFPSCDGLTALQHLDVSENCLSSLEFVEKMPQLEDLCVEGNGLKVGSHYSDFVALHLAMKYEMQCKMWKMGWFVVVVGHSRSLEIVPFDSAQEFLFCTVIVIQFLHP